VVGHTRAVPWDGPCCSVWPGCTLVVEVFVTADSRIGGLNVSGLVIAGYAVLLSEDGPQLLRHERSVPLPRAS